MSRSPRQLIALAVLIVAGLASLATSQGSPELRHEPTDHLAFAAAQRTEVRHVRIEITAGSADAVVTADVSINTGAVKGLRPVTLTVIRNEDGASILDDYGPNYQAGAESSLAGTFTGIECPSGGVCAATFRFTFERIAADSRPNLDFDWSIRASATFEGGASPSPDARLTVTIFR